MCSSASRSSLSICRRSAAPIDRERRSGEFVLLDLGFGTVLFIAHALNGGSPTSASKKCQQIPDTSFQHNVRTFFSIAERRADS
jgi:hypothetical protein